MPFLLPICVAAVILFLRTSFLTFSNSPILPLILSYSLLANLDTLFLTVDFWSLEVLAEDFALVLVFKAMFFSIRSRKRCRVEFPSMANNRISFSVSLISVSVEVFSRASCWGDGSEGYRRSMREIEHRRCYRSDSVFSY